MVDTKDLHAIYDALRDVYVVLSSSRQDGAGDVEYRFKLIEPDESEPRYRGYLEKSWINAEGQRSHQEFFIGYYVYKESFDHDIREIIQEARKIRASQRLGEFMSIVEVMRERIIEGNNADEGRWDDDDREALWSNEGLWTLGPQDAYSFRQRE
jgi:hypothetical protein